MYFFGASESFLVHFGVIAGHSKLFGASLVGFPFFSFFEMAMTISK
jgi:hypothetical protein